MQVKHKFHSAKTQKADPSIVGPNEWNDVHEVIGVGPQTISGTIDGSNSIFTVPSALTNFMLFRNGVLQTNNIDYTWLVTGSTTTITFITQWPPQTGDIIILWGM